MASDQPASNTKYKFPKNNREGFDFFPTDPRWTRAILERVTLPGTVWEPAAGDGAICEVLDEFGYEYYASDIQTGEDFLASDRRADTIITNPPYKVLDDFIRRGLRLADKRLLLLIGLPALASSRKRYDWLWRRTPPGDIYVVQAAMRVFGKPSIFQHAWVSWNLEGPHPADEPSRFHWILPSPDHSGGWGKKRRRNAISRS